VAFVSAQIAGSAAAIGISLLLINKNHEYIIGGEVIDEPIDLENSDYTAEIVAVLTELIGQAQRISVRNRIDRSDKHESASRQIRS